MHSFNWIKIHENTWISQLKSVEDNCVLYFKKISNCSGNVKYNFCLFHDFCDNSNSFNNFINWILHSFPSSDVYLMDYCGHGQSSGTRGHFEKLSNLVSDQLNFLNQLELDTNSKLFLIGHGLGGIVTLDLYNRFNSLIKNRPSGLILSNFIFKENYYSRNNLLFKLANKKITEHLRPLHFFNFNDLTNNPYRLNELGLDPLFVHRPTIKSVSEILAKSKIIYQESYFLDIPIFLASGENDPSISPSGMDYFSKGVKKDYLTQKKYSNMKHDLYNEIDSVNFYEDIKIWIESYESK